MISPRQIKAARALLGWTQTDLARACGLHLNAINKIEKELGEPRTSSLERIKAACEQGGIRFRGQRGVELKEDTFEAVRYEGADFMRKIMDDALAILSTPGSEALVCSVDEMLFESADAEQMKRYYKQMSKRGYTERVITNKNNKIFFNKDVAAYRWLPEKVLGTMSYLVYGNRVAFTQFQPKQTLIIKNNALADSYRAQFEFMWSQAKPFT